MRLAAYWPAAPLARLARHRNAPWNWAAPPPPPAACLLPAPQVVKLQEQVHSLRVGSLGQLEEHRRWVVRSARLSQQLLVFERAAAELLSDHQATLHR
jgi:hypothetical protein